jgi:hypothetical protein
MHPLADAPRVEESRRALAVVERGREAVPPHVGEELRPAPGAERVAVDADDPRDGAAVRIERRRRVVRLDLVDEVVPLVEGDDPGVVVEDADEPGAPLAIADRAVDRLRRALDVRREEGPDRLRRTPRLLVGDGGVEDLVLAVLAPRLGEALDLDVGRYPPRNPEVVADRPHLGERQREQALLRQLDERLVGPRQVDRLDRGPRVGGDLRHREIGARGPPGGGVLDADRLDHRVREQLDRDPLRLKAADPVEEVHRRGVDGVVVLKRPPDRVLDADACGPPDRIRHAGLVAHGDGDVERAVVEPSERAVLGDGVHELVEDLRRFVGGEGGVDPVHVAGARARHGEAEDLAQRGGQGRPTRVAQAGLRSDLDAMNHGGRLARGQPSLQSIVVMDDIDVRDTMTP